MTDHHPQLSQLAKETAFDFAESVSEVACRLVGLPRPESERDGDARFVSAIPTQGTLTKWHCVGAAKALQRVETPFTAIIRQDSTN